MVLFARYHAMLDVSKKNYQTSNAQLSDPSNAIQHYLERHAEKIVSKKNNLHACSAIDSDDLSVYPLTIIRGKEGNDTGNIEWLTNTVEW